MAEGMVITHTGRNLMLERTYTASPSSSAVSRVRFGTGTNTPSEADTDLQNGVGNYYSFITGYPMFKTSERMVVTRAFIPYSDLNGYTLTEAGEFNSDATPKMFSRIVFQAINKSSGVEVAILFKHKVV